MNGNENDTYGMLLEEGKEPQVGVIAALKNHQKRERESHLYIDMKLLPVTSNIVERFFIQQVKLIVTYLRNSLLQPSTLEIIMFLKLNAESMTKMTVQMALTNGSATTDKILPGIVVAG